ncbi:hypothetical protein [Candidatus Tisiphia endosymbiont of Empis tessellata]|uniref:hypothetical protein n=1 Tax=Candidatus Tisiphia endosymbiont of Empis tessellata TaxID=3066259 RepID=UPI00313B90CF
MYTQNSQKNQVIQNLIIKSSTDNSVVISGYASVYNISDQHNYLIVKEELLPQLIIRISSFFGNMIGKNQ